MHNASDVARVLYVWDADYPWDVRTQKVCRSLTAMGHDVHIVARTTAGRPDREVCSEGTVHRMPPVRSLGRPVDRLLSFPAFLNPRWLRHITSVASEVDPHLLIVRDLPLCPTSIWVARRRGTPVVLDMAEHYAGLMQDMWDAKRQRPFDILVRNPRFVTRIERYCLPRLDEIAVVVEESAERLRESGVEPHRLCLVSNTPPRDRVQRALSIRRGQRQAGGRLELAYLGLMEIHRGIRDLLDAVRDVSAQGLAVRLSLIGHGRDLELFRERARAHGLGDDVVHFHGHVPNERALDILATADVGIVPHHSTEYWNSTIPNKLFDYMAAGLAVITSDTAPCARITRETGAGIVYRSGDTSTLARAIVSLNDAHRRAQIARAGGVAIESRYNWERAEEVLADLVRRRARLPLPPRPASALSSVLQ